MSTFFSISMPIHNADKYLDEAIKSVIEQDYCNFELILVDDSSSDRSLQICEQWKSEHPNRIKIVKNKYKGSLCARRSCIRNSCGDYLYIMDSDDYLLDKSALKIWDEIIQENNCDLIIFNCTHNDNYLFNSTPLKNKKIIEGRDMVYLYDAIAKGRLLNPLWDKVFSRKLIDNEDDIYIANSYLSHATDFYQSIAIISAANKVYYLNRTLYFYRQTPGSITHSYNPNMLRSAETIIERRNSIAEKWKYKPEGLAEKLKATALVELCTVINKVIKSPLSNQEKISSLKEIRNSSSFRENYKSKKNLPKGKMLVIELMHLKLYRVLLYTMTAFYK